MTYMAFATYHLFEHKETQRNDPPIKKTQRNLPLCLASKEITHHPFTSNPSWGSLPHVVLMVDCYELSSMWKGGPEWGRGKGVVGSFSFEYHQSSP